MVTLEQPPRNEATDPFNGSVAQPQQHSASPLPPHSPNAYAQQQPIPPASPYNMQQMQDSLPDHNPYRQLQKQRTGNSDGSYPGTQSYLSAGLGHQRTGSQELQPSGGYFPNPSPHPPSSYHSTPPTGYHAPKNPSVSSIGSNSYPTPPMPPASVGVFQMDSDKPVAQVGPFSNQASTAPPANNGDWWDSPISSGAPSPTQGKRELSLEEQLENQFHRGKGSIAPNVQQPAQQVQQSMPMQQPVQQQTPQAMYPNASPVPSQMQNYIPAEYMNLPQPPAFIPPHARETQHQQQQSLNQPNPHSADDVFGPTPAPNTPAVPPKPQLQQQQSLLDIDDINSGTHMEVDKAAQGPIPVSSEPTARPSAPAIPQSIPTETYQIKHIRFLNPATNKLAQSSMLIQNENGPCPLIALVNVLSLSRETLVLGEGLRIRETLSLELLLNVVCEELVVTGSWGGDLSELFNFLLGLRTGMNVNPKFISDDITADDFLRGVNVSQGRALPQPKPGDFEKTRELDLYSAFGIPLVHGWIPAPTSPMFPVLVQHARDFEKAQDIIIQQQFIIEKSSRGENISPDDSEIVAKAHEIQEFLESAGTQLTAYGLNVLQRKLEPGSWSIFFRNSHFSTLYKHANTGELFTLVTDSGYASYEEIVWESLVDGTGRGGAYFSGDFRPVGQGHDNQISQTQSDNILDPNTGGAGWQLVQNRTSSRQQGNTVSGTTGQRRQVQSLIPAETGRPSQNTIIPPDTGDTTDYDLALAIHLQQEEEERANRVAANRAGVNPARVNNTTVSTHQPVRSLIPPQQPQQPQVPRPRQQPQAQTQQQPPTGYRPQQPPRPQGRQAEALRAAATSDSNAEEIPPPYAAADPNPTAFTPAADPAPPGPGNLPRHSSFPAQAGVSRADHGTAYSQMSSTHGQSSSSVYPGSMRGRRSSHMGAHPMAAQHDGEDKKNCSIM